MGLALLLDPLDLPPVSPQSLHAQAEVISCMISNLKTVMVKLSDLFPGQVIPFVRGKIETFRDKKGGPEPVFLEQGSHEGVMRRLGIIEGQHHHFFMRNLGRCLSCGSGRQEHG